MEDESGRSGYTFAHMGHDGHRLLRVQSCSRFCCNAVVAMLSLVGMPTASRPRKLSSISSTIIFLRWCQGKVIAVVADTSKPTVCVCWDAMPDVEGKENVNEETQQVVPQRKFVCNLGTR